MDPELEDEEPSPFIEFEYPSYQIDWYDIEWDDLEIDRNG